MKYLYPETSLAWLDLSEDDLTRLSAQNLNTAGDLLRAPDSSWDDLPPDLVQRLNGIREQIQNADGCLYIDYFQPGSRPRFQGHFTLTSIGISQVKARQLSVSASVYRLDGLLQKGVGCALGTFGTAEMKRLTQSMENCWDELVDHACPLDTSFRFWLADIMAEPEGIYQNLVCTRIRPCDLYLAEEEPEPPIWVDNPFALALRLSLVRLLHRSRTGIDMDRLREEYPLEFPLRTLALFLLDLEREGWITCWESCIELPMATLDEILADFRARRPDAPATLCLDLLLNGTPADRIPAAAGWTEEETSAALHQLRARLPRFRASRYEMLFRLYRFDDALFCQAFPEDARAIHLLRWYYAGSSQSIQPVAGAEADSRISSGIRLRLARALGQPPAGPASALLQEWNRLREEGETVPCRTLPSPPEEVSDAPGQDSQEPPKEDGQESPKQDGQEPPKQDRSLSDYYMRVATHYGTKPLPPIRADQKKPPTPQELARILEQQPLPRGARGPKYPRSRKDRQP